MKIKILWPGRTKNAAIRALEEYYLERIQGLASCQVIPTPAARGLEERFAKKIKEIEAKGLEKHFKDDYIVCLIDAGQEMNSREFAGFLERRAAASSKAVTFVAGGFLGLASRVLERANLRLSLSRMTLSHELCRAVMMEQLYRSLSIMKGRPYAK
jgi:23S rRNA (pseudouridine1915-N3)-methyltransferase